MSSSTEQCLFCNKAKQKIIYSNKLIFVVRDSYPVTKYHTLIIPHRHVSDFFDLILVNINKNVLLDEMENYVERLSGNGMLILSGFFQTDFNDVNSCVSRYNLTLELEKQYKKWQCLVYRK